MNKRFLFYLLFAVTNLTAQSVIHIKSYTPSCTFQGRFVSSDREVTDASTEILKNVESICRKMGVQPTIFKVKAANIPNAEAIIGDDKIRYLLYNPFYINKIQRESQSYWTMIYVLAHEIGHHANYHTLDTENLANLKKDELDADRFGGCAMRHLGASLTDIEKAVSILKEEGDESHPPRNVRFASVKTGWEECKGTDEGNVVKSSPPPSDCEKKQTGDVYFKNATNTRVRIFLSPQSGWRDMNARLTLEPGETKAINNLKVGLQLFVIQSLTKDGYKDYKNDETRINPCIDAAQSPMIIR